MKAVIVFLALLFTGCATVPGDFPYKEEPPKAYGKIGRASCMA